MELSGSTPLRTLAVAVVTRMAIGVRTAPKRRCRPARLQLLYTVSRASGFKSRVETHSQAPAHPFQTLHSHGTIMAAKAAVVAGAAALGFNYLNSKMNITEDMQMLKKLGGGGALLGKAAKWTSIDAFKNAAESWPDKEAYYFIDEDRSLTFAQVWENVRDPSVVLPLFVNLSF